MIFEISVLRSRYIHGVYYRQDKKRHERCISDMNETVIKEVVVMKRIVITNNKKVADSIGNNAEVEYRKMTAIDVFEQARELAKKGGKLVVDPTRTSVKNYYRSLPFLIDGEEANQHSIDIIDEVLSKMKKNPAVYGKEPVMAGIQQGKDLDLVLKVFG